MNFIAFPCLNNSNDIDDIVDLESFNNEYKPSHINTFNLYVNKQILFNAEKSFSEVTEKRTFNMIPEKEENNHFIQDKTLLPNHQSEIGGFSLSHYLSRMIGDMFTTKQIRKVKLNFYFIFRLLFT